MFKSRAFQMDGDHADVSFHAPDGWPETPWRSLKTAVCRIGDPGLGPLVCLVRFSRRDDEELDWKHTVDPMHYHGTDQFRLEVDGSWVTTRHAMHGGHFGYQESGRVYQEHPGADDDHSWLILVYGDKRGEPATLTLAADREALAAGGNTDIGGAGVAATDYPHPAGPKGIPAIATTLGSVDGGHRWGSFDDASGWDRLPGGAAMSVGVLGDREGGPVVCLLRTETAGVVAPAATYGTDCFIAVRRGTCTIGASTYGVGDNRVQAEHTPSPEIVAGDGGADLMVVFGDRRGVAMGDAPDWLAHVQRVIADLCGTLATA